MSASPDRAKLASTSGLVPDAYNEANLFPFSKRQLLMDKVFLFTRLEEIPPIQSIKLMCSKCIDSHMYF